MAASLERSSDRKFLFSSQTRGENHADPWIWEFFAKGRYMERY